MKKVLFILLLHLVFNIGYSQSNNNPVTTIKEYGVWASAVEARNIPLESKILDALYTILSNTSEVENVVKNSNYVSYSTVYKDNVYFILAQGSLPSRVVSVSRIPVENVGMIRRLDNNMMQAAGFYKRCANKTDKDVFNIFAGYEGKFYYTTNQGQYSRGYVDQLGEGFLSEGFLVIPPYSTSFCIRVGNHNGTGVLGTHNISVTIQDQVIAPKFETLQEFMLGTVYNKNKPSGTYKYSIKYAACQSCSRGPNQQFKIFFDCFGANMNEPVSVDVNGNPQPLLVSKNIKDLKIPE